MMKTTNVQRPLREDGYIMQLQNFSVNDGDGIRTTIFLCGCPLNCIWCSNPENRYEIDEAHHITLDEVIKMVSRQALFFRRGGGGVAFSGGEATQQQGFLRAITNAFYDKGYSLSIETCGAFEFEEVRDIFEKMDLIFMDLKLMDADLHRLFTEADNAPILANIANIATLGVPMVVRIPTIVGVNAFDENIDATCAFLARQAPKAKLEFLPYHRLGSDKYTKLGKDQPDDVYTRLKAVHQNDNLPEGFAFTEQMDIPDEKLLQHYADIATRYGIEVVSYR